MASVWSNRIPPSSPSPTFLLHPHVLYTIMFSPWQYHPRISYHRSIVLHISLAVFHTFSCSYRCGTQAILSMTMNKTIVGLSG
jgi:hypothetical protein